MLSDRISRISEYTLGEFTTTQARKSYSVVVNPDHSLSHKVGASVLHIFLVLGCLLVDTVCILAKIGHRLCTSAEDRAARYCPSTIASVRMPNETTPLTSPSSERSAMTQTRSANPPLPPVDLGIGVPSWLVSPAGKSSLLRLPPLRFHPDPGFQIRAGELVAQDDQFSLTSGQRLMYTGDNDDTNTYPAIEYKCSALNELTKRDGLVDSISESSLHCSSKAEVNLPQEFRTDYSIPSDAKYYRFVYPIQLHPDKASAFLTALKEDPQTPPFMTNLLLIGGYAYYNASDQLIQVKSFSISDQATELLQTGRALNPSSISLPENLLIHFNTGVAMTSAQGVWADQSNLLSPHANRITAPTLAEHLTHFSYIPQDLYKDSQNTMDAAPYGGFLYKTKGGEYQFVPVGGDFAHQATHVQTDDDTQDPLSQIRKYRILANLFYPHDATTSVPVNTLPGGRNKIEITVPGSQSRYEITAALNERKIIIKKREIGFLVEAQATINAAGEISQLSGNFEQFVNEVYPHLMAQMIEVDLNIGRIRTLKESILFAPAAHLQALVNFAQRNFFTVNYLDLNERRYVVVDAGGPKRDYVCEVFSGILRYSDLFQEIGSEDSDSPNPDEGLFELKPVPEGGLSEAQRAIFRNLGTFFSWILKNPEFPTGKYLTQSFFDQLLFYFRNPNPTHDQYLSVIGQLLIPLKARAVLSMNIPSLPTDPKIIETLKYWVSDLLNLGDDFTLTNLTWNHVRAQAQQKLIENFQKESQHVRLVAASLRSTNLNNGFI